MKRLTFFLYLATCMAISLASFSRLGTTQARTTNPQAQLRINVEARPSSRIPAKVESAFGVIDNAQTVLRYKVANHGGKRLTALGMIALIVDRNGEVKGGEGWRVNQILAVNSTEEFLRVMSTKLESGNSLILTAWQASGDSETFELDKSDLDVVLKSHTGRRKSTSSVKYINAAFQDSAQYCRGWYEYAKTNCPCGVKTFSCNPKDGSFSWTCFTKQEAPDCENGGLGPDQPTNNPE
jgi:hypothetical protein